MRRGQLVSEQRMIISAINERMNGRPKKKLERWGGKRERERGSRERKAEMASVLSVGLIFRVTKGQAGGEGNRIRVCLSPQMASRDAGKWALSSWDLFRPNPHLHDKHCHFEAACVISASLSLTPDLLLWPLLCLVFVPRLLLFSLLLKKKIIISASLSPPLSSSFIF